MFKRTTQFLSPDAAPGTGAPAAQSAGSPAPSAPVSHDGANEQGPDFTAYAPETVAPVPAAAPVQTGQAAPSIDPSKPVAEAKPGDAEKPAAELDPDAATTAWLESLNEDAKPAPAVVPPEQQQALKAFDKLAAVDPAVLAAKLADLGVSAEDAKEIVNANKLVGRLGQEKGELLKDKQAFTSAMSQLGPLMEFDQQTGRPSKLNVKQLLEFGAQTMGVEGVRAELASAGLELVAVGTTARLAELPAADPSDAVAADVAKAFKIDTTDMSADDVLLMIQANPRANAAFQRKLSAMEAEAQQAGSRKAVEQQQQQQQRAQEITKAVETLKAKVPAHLWAETEKTVVGLIPLYQQAQKSIEAQVSLLNLAAQGKLAGARYQASQKAAFERGQKAAYASLGLQPPAAEKPAPVRAPSLSSRFNAEENEEQGPDLVGAGRDQFARS